MYRFRKKTQKRHFPSMKHSSLRNTALPTYDVFAVHCIHRWLIPVIFSISIPVSGIPDEKLHHSFIIHIYIRPWNHIHFSVRFQIRRCHCVSWGVLGLAKLWGIYNTGLNFVPRSSWQNLMISIVRLQWWISFDCIKNWALCNLPSQINYFFDFLFPQIAML